MSREKTCQRTLNRRDFIKRTALGTAGLAMASTLPGLPGRISWAGEKASQVVIITDQGVSSGLTIMPEVLQVMVDRGIMELTGETGVGTAWRSLFPDITPEKRIAIKVNCASPDCPSHPEVTSAIVEGLAQMEVGKTHFPRNNVLIWERTSYELSRAGFTLYSDSDPDISRCMGSNQAEIGYDESAALEVLGHTCYPSTILTQHSDYLINLSVLKNHGVAGVTLSLKNHYGSIHRAQDLHGPWGAYCDPYLPTLNQLIRDQLGIAQVLHICDAIFGIYTGGPTGTPQFAYNGLLMSRDPVALDYQGLQILEDHGCQSGYQATHIASAAYPPYELGTNDPQQMDVRYITNPATGITGDDRPGPRPDQYHLDLPYPNPFNSRTVIPYVIGGERTVHVLIEIFNVRGQRVRRLFRGPREPGAHQLIWDGRDGRGASLASGTYLCRFHAAEHNESAKIVLLK